MLFFSLQRRKLRSLRPTGLHGGSFRGRISITSVLQGQSQLFWASFGKTHSPTSNPNRNRKPQCPPEHMLSLGSGPWPGVQDRTTLPADLKNSSQDPVAPDLKGQPASLWLLAVVEARAQGPGSHLSVPLRHAGTRETVKRLSLSIQSDGALRNKRQHVQHPGKTRRHRSPKPLQPCKVKERLRRAKTPHVCAPTA